MKKLVIVLLVLTSLLTLVACERESPPLRPPEPAEPVTGLLLRAYEDELLFYIPPVKGAAFSGPLTVVPNHEVDLPENPEIGATYYLDIDGIERASTPIGFANAFVKQDGLNAIDPYIVMNINEGIDLCRIAWGRLVDVRTPEEYAAGHIDGAELIPLQELEHYLPDLLADNERPLFIYCRSGNRSNQALQRLKNEGFPLIFDIGGMNAFDPEATRLSSFNLTSLKALALNVRAEEKSLDIWVPDSEGKKFSGPLVVDMKEGHRFSQEILPGDTVLVIYNEVMTRSYPGQILANKVTVVLGQTYGDYLAIDMERGKDLAVMFDLPLLDLRDADAYAAGHLPGAISCPADALPDGLEDLPPDRPVLVYSTENAIPQKIQKKLIKAALPLILDLGDIAAFDGDLERK